MNVTSLVFSLQPLCVSAAHTHTHTGDYKQEVEKKQTAADENKEVNAVGTKLESLFAAIK